MHEQWNRAFAFSKEWPMFPTWSAQDGCWHCHSTALVGKEVRHQQFMACTNCGATMVEKLPVVERQVLPAFSGMAVLHVMNTGERQVYENGRVFWRKI